MNASWLTYERDAYSYVWHDLFIRVTWFIHRCDMTHIYVWHDSCIYATWLIHMCDMTHSYVRHDSFIRVTWLNHICDMTHLYFCSKKLNFPPFICDMTHSYVWHDSFVCVAWLIHMCHMTHSYVWYDSFICVAWLIHMRNMTHSYSASRSPNRPPFTCDMTPSYVQHDSIILFIEEPQQPTLFEIRRHESSSSTSLHKRVTWLVHDSFVYVTWLIHVCVMTHTLIHYVRHDSYMWFTTHSYVWYDSLICIHPRDMTRNSPTRILLLLHSPAQTCDMTHSYTKDDALMSETSLVHMWDMTHCSLCFSKYADTNPPPPPPLNCAHAWHDSIYEWVISVESCHTNEWVMSVKSCHTNEWVVAYSRPLWSQLIDTLVWVLSHMDEPWCVVHKYTHTHTYK